MLSCGCENGDDAKVGDLAGAHALLQLLVPLPADRLHLRLLLLQVILRGGGDGFPLVRVAETLPRDLLDVAGRGRWRRAACRAGGCPSRCPQPMTRRTTRRSRVGEGRQAGAEELAPGQVPSWRRHFPPDKASWQLVPRWYRWVVEEGEAGGCRHGAAAKHKGAWRGLDRSVFLGPKAHEVLAPR